MELLEFGQMITFDQGYGDYAVVLDDKGDTIRLIMHGEEPEVVKVIVRSDTYLAFLNENYESVEWALNKARREYGLCATRWDRNSQEKECKYEVGDFVDTAYIGKWKVYPRPEPGVPKGLSWQEVCKGAVKTLEEMHTVNG